MNAVATVDLLEQPIDFGRHFIPETLTPLAHTALWLRLEPRHRLRYNQLQALFFNEQIIFFETRVGTGIMQALLQSRGSLESAVELVGAPFHALRQGEFWRLATGPLLHNGLSHFIGNAVFFLLAAPLAFVLFRGWAVAALFLANAAGALVQMAVGSPVFDAYLGISPGVFCLMLFVAVAGRMDKVLLPRGMAEMTAAIAVISIVAAEMLSTNAATAAHLTGAAFGIAFGLAWVRVASGRR